MDPHLNHAFQPNGIVRRGAGTRWAACSASSRQSSRGLWRSGGETQPKIADVSAGNLSYTDAATAVAAGVMPPLDGGTFQLSRPVSGQEAIDVIDRWPRSPEAANANSRPSRPAVGRFQGWLHLYGCPDPRQTVTLGRIPLIPAFVILISDGYLGWALIVSLGVAGLTDLLDGLTPDVGGADEPGGVARSDG